MRNAGDGYQGIVIVRVVVRCKESDLPITDKFEVLTDTKQTQWTAPIGIESLDVFLVGGGGGGVSLTGLKYATGAAVGGSGGKTLYKENIEVSPGETISIKIGAGGAEPTAGSTTGNPGGKTTFSTYTAAGGENKKKANTNVTNGKACPFGGISDDIKDGDLFGASGGGAFVDNNGYLKLEDGGITGGGNGGNFGATESVFISTAGSFYGAGGGSAGTTGTDGYVKSKGKAGYQGIIIIRMHIKKQVLTNYTPPA